MKCRPETEEMGRDRSQQLFAGLPGIMETAALWGAHIIVAFQRRED